MVRIRLRRMGLRHQPYYRIVVADRESPRDGRFLEVVGTYNPRTEPSTIVVKEERVYHWMGHGAQPSESVAKLFKQIGLADRYQRLKQGEKADALLAEAETAKKERPVEVKTRREVKGPSKKRPKAKKKEAEKT
ncbi:MAG: 30S ribosomal protein S16 [Anaerolineales bacterium]|nr:30S ribosomal protein S16 [Anaerolineales bacterium]